MRQSAATLIDMLPSQIREWSKHLVLPLLPDPKLPTWHASALSTSAHSGQIHTLSTLSALHATQSIHCPFKVSTLSRDHLLTLRSSIPTVEPPAAINIRSAIRSFTVFGKSQLVTLLLSCQPSMLFGKDIVSGIPNKELFLSEQKK